MVWFLSLFRFPMFTSIFGVDDIIIGGIASGAGAGIGNALAQSSANQANRELQEDAQAYNWESMHMEEAWARQARMDQMVFQREMSNSAYQRATADMKAAGINPMVAFSQGGASTPSGGGGSASGASSPMTSASSTQWGDSISRALSSAMEVQKMGYTLDQMGAQTALAKAGVAKEVAGARQMNASSAISEARLSAEREKAGFDQAQAKYDKKFQEFDNWTKRILQGLNVGSGAKDMLDIRKILPKMDMKGFDKLLKRHWEWKSKAPPSKIILP